MVVELGVVAEIAYQRQLLVDSIVKLQKLHGSVDAEIVEAVAKQAAG